MNLKQKQLLVWKLLGKVYENLTTVQFPKCEPLDRECSELSGKMDCHEMSRKIVFKTYVFLTRVPSFSEIIIFWRNLHSNAVNQNMDTVLLPVENMFTG